MSGGGVTRKRDWAVRKVYDQIYGLWMRICWRRTNGRLRFLFPDGTEGAHHRIEVFKLGRFNEVGVGAQVVRFGHIKE